jgi:hypothetical protein
MTAAADAKAAAAASGDVGGEDEGGHAAKRAKGADGGPRGLLASLDRASAAECWAVAAAAIAAAARSSGQGEGGGGGGGSEAEACARRATLAALHMHGLTPEELALAACGDASAVAPKREALIRALTTGGGSGGGGGGGAAAANGGGGRTAGPAAAGGAAGGRNGVLTSSQPPALDAGAYIMSESQPQK